MHVPHKRTQRATAIALPSGPFAGATPLQRTMTLLLAIAFALTALGLASPAHAAARSRYVSPSGSNSNSGTSSSPWKTISKAAGEARPGDTIYVRPGTYAERVYVTNSGTSTSPIRFVGLTSSGKRARVSQGFYVKSNWVRIESFEIYPATGLGNGTRNPDRTYADAPLQLSGSRIVAKGNYIHDTRSAPWAILTNGSGNVLQANKIHNANKGHISASGTDVMVRKNKSTIDPSFFSGKPANYKAIQLQLGSTSGMLIERNTFKGPGDGNLVHIPVAVSNVTFKRNVILMPARRTTSSTHTQTFGFYKSATNVTFDGNIIGSNAPLPSGFVAGFTHFFFGTTDASGTFKNLKFQNNLFLGKLDGAYYLQFKAGDKLDGLTFNNNLVNIPSGWRLPDSSSGVSAKNNIVLKGSIGGARDYNLYPGSKPAGEGSHSRTGAPKFVNGSMSSSTSYGVKADWNLQSGSDAIDCGTSSGSSSRDRLGRTRVDISSVTNRGGGSPNYIDIGPMEKQR
ncbi:MAG TPA: right-handed parallel beta-helix repeat-containing protein [Coriobacteriia bacterium]|nr:right-handed parallel beta-helix repeat-containing protein [Coriobacteriia bacterium]